MMGYVERCTSAASVFTTSERASTSPSTNRSATMPRHLLRQRWRRRRVEMKAVVLWCSRTCSGSGGGIPFCLGAQGMPRYSRTWLTSRCSYAFRLPTHGRRSFAWAAVATALHHRGSSLLLLRRLLLNSISCKATTAGQ